MRSASSYTFLYLLLFFFCLFESESSAALLFPVHSRSSAGWNGFREQVNVLECSNPAPANNPPAATLLATLYRSNGDFLKSRAFSVPPRDSVHIVLNELHDSVGRGIENDYGIIILDSTSPQGAEPRCFVAVYRMDGAGLPEYSHAIPVANSLHGSTSGVLNSFSPDPYGGRTENWLTVTNPGQTPFEATVHTYRGGVEDASPTFVRLLPRERRDILLVAADMRTSVYRIDPVDSTLPYNAFLVRYGDENSFSAALPAAPPQRRAELAVQTVYGALDWLELGNVAAQSLDVKISVFRGGTRVSQQLRSVPAQSHLSVFVNELLGASEVVGQVVVETVSTEAPGFIAANLVYSMREDGHLAWAYGSYSSRAPVGRRLGIVALANTYLAAPLTANWLTLLNTDAGRTYVLSLYPQASTRRTLNPVTLPIRGTASIALHAELPTNTLGQLFVTRQTETSVSPGSELLRVFYRPDGSVRSVLNVPVALVGLPTDVPVTAESSDEVLCNYEGHTLSSDVIPVSDPSDESGLPPADATGASDSYAALQAAAALVSSRASTSELVLLFGKGNYRIDGYIAPGNGKADISYHDTENFRLLGCNAKISVDGAILKTHGSPITDPPGHFLQREKAIIPFRFQHCSHFAVSGFDSDPAGSGYGLELDGRVYEMSRPLDVVEDAAYGVATYACNDSHFENLDIHHFSTDGLLIGGGLRVSTENSSNGIYHTYQADVGSNIIHVRSSNNARQGLTVAQVQNLTVSESVFRDSGRTAEAGQRVSASFPGFAPQAGVDAEPNYPGEFVCIANCDQPAPTFAKADLRTENITFTNCTFADSIGGQFVSTVGGYIDGITIQNPEVEVKYSPSLINSTEEPNSGLDVLRFATSNVLVEGGTIDTGPGRISASDVHTANLTPLGAEVSTTIDGALIRSSGRGILSTGDRPLFITNNSIIGTQTDPFTSFMPYLQNPQLVFRGNHIFMPTAAQSGAALHVVGLIEFACRPNEVAISGNVFQTDLNAVGKAFAVYYSFSRVSPPGDLFQNPQFFHPSPGSLQLDGSYTKDDCSF